MSGFNTERHVKKTRKSRVCFWCGEEIQSGSSCVHVAAKITGEDFFSDSFHCECNDAYHRAVSEDPDYLFGPYEHRRGSTAER